MKAAERLELARKWASYRRHRLDLDSQSRKTKRIEDELACELLATKLPKSGLIVPAGIVMLDCSKHAVPSWRTIAEAYVSPELIAEEIAALPVVPRLVLVANQAS